MRYNKKISLYTILLCCVFTSTGILSAQTVEKQAPIKLSLVKWSFRTMTSRLCEHAKLVGVNAIEMVDEEKWPVIKQYGLNITVADGADLGVWAGFCDEDLHKRLQKRYMDILPKLQQYGISKLICYSGVNTRVNDKEALEICASGLLPVVREAEKYGVTLVMELLSSRETDLPFAKQRFVHYRCDNPEWGALLCEKIGSSNFRLCYDVWHMADMQRDVPADIARYGKYISHYHIADLKNRRGTFSDDDRIFYQKVFSEIRKSGYNGYIGLEFDRIENDIFELLQSSVEFVNNVQKTDDLAWGDSLNLYVQEQYMLADQYWWNWREATYLRAVADRYENGIDRERMLQYIRRAMDVTWNKAHGTHPNGVASCFGMALLARADGAEKYRQKALDIYEQYTRIPRASNGGVSHRNNVIELWDDTVYMISLFLLEMYRLTGEEKYLTEIVFQLKAHAEKLKDEKTGLWYHGWDNDDISTDDECCMIGWADNPDRRNNEFWGRGNGWVAMTLVNTLNIMPDNFPGHEEIQEMFLQMMQTLISLQDFETGHWRQLPIHNRDEENFIESSCTAMLAYSMALGIRSGILPAEVYRTVVDRAYSGIEKYSLKPVGKYLTIGNVCAGTCIGDEAYYYHREIVEGTRFALGVAIMFYDQYHLLSVK